MILLTFAISSCANVNVAPDIPVFAEMEPDVMYYHYTLSKKSGVVTKDRPFTDEKFMLVNAYPEHIKMNSVILPYKSYQEIKDFILKECKIRKESCPPQITDQNQ